NQNNLTLAASFGLRVKYTVVALVNLRFHRSADCSGNEHMLVEAADAICLDPPFELDTLALPKVLSSRLQRVDGKQALEATRCDARVIGAEQPKLRFARCN